MKICLECSDGGHLDEMMALLDAFEDHEFFFVTFTTPTTMGLDKIAKTIHIRNFSSITDPAKLPNILFWLYTVFYLLIMVPTCLKILFYESPDVILSTGGGITIPLSYLAKIKGLKIIYLESVARTESPSLTGRVVYPVADLFLVQWKSLLGRYKKAKYWGRVI